VGVLLVLVSVGGTTRLVSAATRAEPVYLAQGPLLRGEQLDPARLQIVEVRLGSAAGAYLTPAILAQHPERRAIIRTVQGGELVPLAALADSPDSTLSPIAIPLPGLVEDQLTPGGRVDVWAAVRQSGAAQAAYAQPERLASGVDILRITWPKSGLGVAGSGPPVVHVLLAQDQVPKVLDALANEAKLTLIPVGR
jgi:hypothetical protein